MYLRISTAIKFHFLSKTAFHLIPFMLSMIEFFKMPLVHYLNAVFLQSIIFSRPCKSSIQQKFLKSKNVLVLQGVCSKSSAGWIEKCRKLCSQSLTLLFKHFPVLQNHCNIVQKRVKEWRSYVNLQNDYFNVHSSHDIFEFYNINVEFYWSRVFASKPQFFNLKLCITLFLSLPFRDVSAARFFSSMKLTKSSIRSRLHEMFVSALLKGNSLLKKPGEFTGKVKIPYFELNWLKRQN